ncbi:hypothetical protein [Salinibacter ruber]|uniref:CopG family transcriptional regulator n=1 Tax=Salinibacter ruber TaxID=146919 RepID=A0A9X2Q7S3_9BACT|nr:hypothetical protein [Salinibacter ruber]MCS3661994.1 hypothetical protein [Salinibacter ruber]MCS3711789.1 hypothetical protein [Salinibacter ruber]MCS4048052.1 hypothetical protein [Salinibacter ruber]MCS4119344.1 hypothetical protein [Salinibacter ruber]MCS4142632.1 hypothetical protein [Salinibacter ruber]
MDDLGDAAERGKDKDSPGSLSDMTSREDEPTVRYTIDFPKSLHTDLKKQATIDEDRSMKALIIEAVDQYLSENA